MADEAGLAEQASSLLGRRLTDPAKLAGSPRSVVIRATVAGTAHTVIVKRFLTNDWMATSFAREVAGLSVLPATATLLAADGATRTVVMSDVGTHRTLADHLRGTDPEDAWAAAVAWAGALGRLVGAGASCADQFGAEHHRWGGTDDAAWLATTPAEGARRLQHDLALAAPPGLDDDLARIAALGDPGVLAVVSPGDTCPDNALVAGPAVDDVTFLDLEATSVHHVALDAAYLVLPFASCWCVFVPPRGLVDSMTSAFTTEAEDALPSVAAQRFWSVDVKVAGAAWVLASVRWLFDRAMQGDGRIGPPDGAAPTSRELMVGRWHWGATHLCDELPAVAQLMAEAERWSVREWGAQPRRGYPAFSPR